MSVVYFLCNGKNPKCADKCKTSECIHTTDPQYAKNFVIEKNDNYDEDIIVEKTPDDKSGTFFV